MSVLLLIFLTLMALILFAVLVCVIVFAFKIGQRFDSNSGGGLPVNDIDIPEYWMLWNRINYRSFLRFPPQ